MLGHFLQFPQGGMNTCYKNFRTDSQKKADKLLNSDHEQVYLFYFVGSLEKTAKYNLGGNKSQNLHQHITVPK